MAIAQVSTSQDLAQQLSTKLSSSRIQLVPYAPVSGQWNLSEEFLAAVMWAMQVDGSLDQVFYGGDMDSSERFFDTLQKALAVFAFGPEESCIGFGWLDNLSGNLAFAHFGFLKDVPVHQKMEAGRLTVSYWLSLPSINTLIGFSPWEAAARFSELLGFKRVGEIPAVLDLPDAKAPAIITYIQRSDHG